MKSILFALAALGLVSAAQADQTVNGYTRRDVTYVAPYHRTTPNSTRLDNYSTQGNVNPYTGQSGHVNPYPAPSYGMPRAPTYPAQTYPRYGQ